MGEKNRGMGRRGDTRFLHLSVSPSLRLSVSPRLSSSPSQLRFQGPGRWWRVLIYHMAYVIWHMSYDMEELLE